MTHCDVILNMCCYVIAFIVVTENIIAVLVHDVILNTCCYLSIVAVPNAVLPT